MTPYTSFDFSSHRDTVECCVNLAGIASNAFLRRSFFPLERLERFFRSWAREKEGMQVSGIYVVTQSVGRADVSDSV